MSSSLTGVMAQHAVVPSGGEGSGSGGSISFSVGQVVYQATQGSSASVAEGVQQAYEVSVVTGLSEISTFSIGIFPNPTTDFLFLNIDQANGITDEELTYKLIDLNGQILISRPIIDASTRIDMRNCAPAPYFLRIQMGSQEIKTIKIIKNQ